MKDISHYDDGFYDELGPSDKKDFDDLCKEKAKSVDEDGARKSYERSFESNQEAEYRLFRDIVNAFSSRQGGFEATIANPLYEFGKPKAEVLLAKPQSNSLHLCFVACEVGGHDYMQWSSNVNETHRLTSDNQAIQSLKDHINCSKLDIGSIQYVTIARDIDLVDADVQILKAGAEPEYYAIWELIRSADFDETTGKMEENKTIAYHDGNMSVPDFESVCQEGVDPTAADNDDLKYCLTSHPVFPIGEVCLDLYLAKYGSDDHPKEFYESEFKAAYLDNIYFGNDRGALTSIAKDKAVELLDFSLEHGILSDNSDIVDERDYKIMWSSKDGGDIKPMVKDKFIESMVPEEKWSIAYSRAREVFEKGEHTFDDFDEFTNE